MAANEYWLKRLKRDRALADRAAAEVQAEVRQVLRGQYYQTVRQMESLYAEAQSRGELSRTKLWNYRKWLDQEKRLREFADDFSVFQEKKAGSGEAAAGIRGRFFRVPGKEDPRRDGPRVRGNDRRQRGRLPAG